MIYKPELLLSPIGKEKFRKSVYGQKAALINPSNADLTALLNWRDFFRLLKSRIIPLEKLNLSLNGHFYLPSGYEEVPLQLKNGMTISIRGLEKYLPGLSELCKSWSVFFNARTGVNLYVSYPGHCGLGLHYDTHDIFIIQLHGKKKWMFFPDTVKFPLPEIREKEYGRQIPDEKSCYLNTLIEKGNIYYLPRGHWHQALAAEPSMHLAVSVRYLTGTGLFKWLLKKATYTDNTDLKGFPFFSLLKPFENLITEKLVKIKETGVTHEIAVIVEDDADFRADFPLIFADEINSSEKQNEIKEHLEMLFKKVHL